MKQWRINSYTGLGATLANGAVQLQTIDFGIRVVIGVIGIAIAVYSLWNLWLDARAKRQRHTWDVEDRAERKSNVRPIEDFRSPRP